MHRSIQLLIVATGEFALDVADLIDDIPGIELVGFVAGLPPYPYTPGTTLLDRPIYSIDELAQFDSSYRAVCAGMNSRRHEFVARAAAQGMQFTSIVHPSARISRRACIGEGCIVNAGAQVATHSQIGRHVIVNRGALVSHHNVIDDYATIGPGANLAGGVRVGHRAWIGLGAVVLGEHRIGAQSIVGAGALVTHDVPERTKVLGVPARTVEENIDGF